MDPPPYLLAQPTNRGSTIAGKFASKVLSLIEKYESLSVSGTVNQEKLCRQPSHLTPRSTFHRLGKSVLARTRLFVENATAEKRSSYKLEKIAPPKRKFLKLSRKHFKQHATKNGSNGFDYDGTISSSGSTLDIEISLTASTPPVARILPSSFFSQLGSSKKQKLIPGNTNPRGKWRNRKMSPPNPAAKRFGANIDPKESVFAEIKRKFVLPKISVRDLTERYQETSIRGELSLGEVGEPFRLLSHGRVQLKETKRSPQILPREGSNFSEMKRTYSIFSREDSEGEDRPFDGLLDDNPVYHDSYTNLAHERWAKNELISAFGPAQLMCRDDMNYLNTDFKYMADGSLSNFGYFLLRLETEAESLKPETEADTPNASTFFTAHTHIEGPEAKTVKVYRKTPPPSGFFLSPENKRIRGKTSAGLKIEEFYIARPFSTMGIISPTPMNAVQSAQLRGMVFRYT